MSSIQGVEKIFRRVAKLAKDAKQIERPLKASSVLMLGSIERNFQAQGRPKTWTKLADSTLSRRRTGKGKGKAQILIDRGIFKNSFSYRLVNGGTEIGSNAVQGPRMHFGYPKGKGRGRSKTPARPVVMFQEEDIREIGQIFSRHVRS